MSATLEPGVSAFDLTPADFYFLMYWQRVNSFTKTPQIITATCTDPKHVAKVDAKELPDTSLKIEQFLNSTTLDTKYADILDLSEFQTRLAGYDLHVETMRDVVEMTEKLIDLAEAEAEATEGTPGTRTEKEDDSETSEYGWLATRAAFLNPSISLDERCKIIGDMAAEDVAELDKYSLAVTDYGVEEYATIKCKECGASKRVKISFDALTFLPGG